MNLAKQSTAKLFLVGPILDADGVSVTGAKTATDVLKVTKNGTVGAADAQDTMAHSHTGHYVVTTDGGDFDTLGEVEFSLNDTTNAMSPVKFQVVPAGLWDTLLVVQPCAAILKFFNAASPTGTVNSLPDAVAGAANGLFIAGTNAATAITTALTANITGNITGTLATVTTLTNHPATVAVASIADGAITAAAIANGAIDNATFAADVGSTAAATNIISQAVELVIKENNLDHLIKTAKDTNWATTVTKESVIDLMTSKDTSQTFFRSEDSLEAIRDRGDAAWLTGAGAAADAAVFPSGVTKVVGGTLTGDHTKLAVIDADYCSLVETTTTTLLELNVAFAATAKSLAVGLRVWGYYSGSQTHYIRVQALDQIGGSVYEDVGLMSNASVVTNYVYDLGPNHIHATTGAVAIKFLHSPPGTGIGTHVLYLDKVYVSTVSPVVNLTAAEVVDAWETQSQADPTGFRVNVMEIAGTAQTAGDLAAAVITNAAGTDIAADIIALKTVADATATSASEANAHAHAIDLQTAKLAFTVANQVDANIQYINDVAITGNGGTGTEFGV